MAFDFPSGPTVGQTHNGFTWDGVAWNTNILGIPEANNDDRVYGRRNGVWVVTQEIFDLSGLQSVTVSIPSWVTHVDFTMHAFGDGTDATSFLRMQPAGEAMKNVSGQYSTYGVYWPYTSPALTSYSDSAATGTVIASSFGLAGWHSTVKTNFKVDRPNTTKAYGAFSSFQVWPAAGDMATGNFSGGLYAASAGSTLRLEAFQIFRTTGIYGTGSKMTVRWS